MNRLVLIGRTTKEVELKTTTTGNSIVRFTLAVDRKNRSDGADFINCVAYGKCAELIERHVRKGHRIAVSGHIQTGSYEKDGKRVYTTDVVADSVEFLEKKQRDEFAPISDDDLPFD